MIVCVRWASAFPEGLVKQTCSISTLCGACRASLRLFPLHLHAHTHQHAFSCTYLHSGTRTRVMWLALESPQSSLCAASHAVTLRHTTHVCFSMCVYVLCCSCISAHTHSLRGLCVGGESGEQWWVLLSVWSLAPGRVCAHLCVYESPVFWCTYTRR